MAHFRIEIEINGKRTELSAGAEGFNVLVMQEDHGTIIRSAQIIGTCKDDGKTLECAAFDLNAPGEDPKLVVTTER